jgi:hypothetical protein
MARNHPRSYPRLVGIRTSPRSGEQRMGMGRFSLLFTAILGVSLAVAQNNSASGTPANELVRTVVANELRLSERDPSRWRYDATKVENGQNQTKRVVEMRDGALERLIAANGKSLSVEQQIKETERINLLVNHPQEQEKLSRQQHQDAAQCAALIKMMPDAFTFQYAGQTAGQTGDLIHLTFSPNPAFRPSSWQARVMHAMAGDLWINVKDQRLAAINGNLTEDVKFGGGLLGHLASGGHFNVQRANIGSGHWEITSLNVDMNGKALLLKSIGIRRQESKANFKRVADNLAAQDAAEELNRQTTLALKK